MYNGTVNTDGDVDVTGHNPYTKFPFALKPLIYAIIFNIVANINIAFEYFLIFLLRAHMHLLL